MTHLQTLLGLRADRLRETDESRRGKDTLEAELTVTTGAEALEIGILHVFGHGQIGWMKIPTRFLIIVKNPILPILRRKILSFWKSRRRLSSFGRKMHTECAKQRAEESAGSLSSTQDGSYQDTSTGCIYKVRGPTTGQVCR